MLGSPAAASCAPRRRPEPRGRRAQVARGRRALPAVSRALVAGRPGEREGQAEDRPGAARALDFDGGAVRLRDDLRDRKAEAAAGDGLFDRPATAVEPIEEVRLLGPSDADTRVGHLEDRLGAFTP